MKMPKIDPWSIPCNDDFAIAGLAHGLIFPQKGLFNSRFCKNKSRTDVNCARKGEETTPDFIKVLVGSKKALREWLRSAGPGSCSLWAEISDEDVNLSNPDTASRLFKGQLHMAYRLRSVTPLILPVFPGTYLILSPQVSQQEGSLVLHEEVNGNSACGKWHSLRQREKEKFLRSIGVNYLGDYFCVSYGHNDQGIVHGENWIRRWILGLPIVLYGQLTNMIAPGGSLWQFQQLVERIVYKPFFVDVDFELIDFRLWLEHHAYITVLEKSDFLIVLSSLQWAVVRFNFSEDDHMMITGDRCLNSLQQLWQEKRAISHGTTSKGTKNSAPILPDHIASLSNQARKWKLWHSLDQNNSSQGTSLLDVICSEGGFSESRFAGMLRQDFCFLGGVPSGGRFVGVHELQTCNLTGSSSLSSKEKCALSNLGSSSRTARKRGTHILLDILLGDLKRKDFISPVDRTSDSLNGRGFSTPVSGRSINHVNNRLTSRSEGMSSNGSSGALSENDKGENIKERDIMRKQQSLHSIVQNNRFASKGSLFSSQNNKHQSSWEPLDGIKYGVPSFCGTMHLKESEGLHFSKLFRIYCEGLDAFNERTDSNEVPHNVEATQMKLLDWVQGGFLEGLMEDVIYSSGKVFSNNEVILGVDDVANICLKISAVLPSDSSTRIVNALMGWLRDSSVHKDLFNCIFENSGLRPHNKWEESSNESYDRENTFRTLREQVERVHYSSKLLLSLVRGSAFVASSVAKHGGLAFLLDIYTCLVKLGMPEQVGVGCPVPEVECPRGGPILPGGVLEHKKTHVKVSSLSMNSQNGLNFERSVDSESSRSISYTYDASMKEEPCIQQRNECSFLVYQLLKKFSHTISFILLCGCRRRYEYLKAKFQSCNGHAYDAPDTSWEASNARFFCNSSFDSASTLRSPIMKLETSNQTKPKVPKLMLRTYAEVKKNIRDTSENFFLDRATQSVSRMLKAPEGLNYCRGMLLEAKINLLGAYIALLQHNSAAAVAAQKELISKLPTNMHTIISLFIVDMFNCLKSFPQTDGKRLQESIFEVMYQLDNLLTNSNIQAPFVGHISQSRFIHYCKYIPIMTDAKKMIMNERFLQETLDNLREVFLSVSQFLWKSTCVGSKERSTNTLSFQTWQNISTLICIIAEYHTYFTKRGFQCVFLNDVIGLFEHALGLFAELGEPSSWGVCQILAMQSFLHLIWAAFQALKAHESYASSSWTQYEEQLWAVLVNCKKNWNCMKSYLSWFIIESCHGCLKNVYDYWKFCSDIPEALAILLFSKPEFCFESPGFDCLRDAFDCLGFLITLFHRKLCAQSENMQEGISLFSPDDVAGSLDFLMNPVDGLIINTLKGPGFLGRVIQTERDINRHSLDCKILSEESISLLRSNHGLEVSPCILSSGKPSITSVSDLSSSVRALTEKSLTEMLIAQTKYAHKSRHCQTLNTVLNGPFNGTQFEVKANQRSSPMESSDCSFRSRIEYSQCLCHSCPSTLVAKSLSFRASMLIEQKSIDLLVQVFGLNLIPKFPLNVHQKAKSVVPQNPFLSKKYVSAFLSFHFLSFLQLYNWKTDIYRGKLSRQLSCTYPMPNNDVPLRLDAFSITENMSGNDFPLVPSEEETINSACRKHVEVLLSLSQHQTTDVSRQFKDLRVMEFLIHQISLEYELSHVATPKEAPHGLGSSDSLILVSENQNSVHCIMNKHGKEEKSEVADRLMISLRMKDIPLSCSTQSTDRKKAYQEETMKKMDSTTVTSIGNVFKCQKLNTRGSLCDISGTDPDFARSIHNSRVLNENPSLEQSFSCMPGNQRASSTCRTVPKSSHWKRPIYTKGDSSQADADMNCQSLSVEQQKRINFHVGIPSSVPHQVKLQSINRKSKKRYKSKDIPVGKKHALKLPVKLQRHCNKLNCNQYVGSSFLANEGRRKGTERLSCCRDPVAAPSKTHFNPKSSSDILDASTSTEGVTCNGTFVYSGRFCDLNEEVENELAREDAETCFEGNNSNQSISNVPNDATIEKLLASSRSEPALKQQNVLGTRRPLVPKLNLPKSARKSDEAEKSVGVSGLSRNVAKADEDHQTKELPDMSGLLGDTGHLPSGCQGVGLSYERERMRRRIYRDFRLHALILELFVSLMIAPEGNLETRYTDRFPMEGQKMNAPFYLLYHINHVANSKVRLLLMKRIKTFCPSVLRILKLVWRDLFDSSLYTNRKRIAHGAFAQIYTATFAQREGGDVHCRSVVLKTVDLPKGPHEPCKFFDVYSEVEILEKFTGDPRICQLLDYGVDIESFILVLKHYKCSLRYWRQHHCSHKNYSTDMMSEKPSQNFYAKLPLYLEIYSAVLQAASILKGGECTVRNRGTECVKSPEMLKLLCANNQDESVSYNPSKDESVGRAVDVWGLGCLLYELLTGEYLLYDEDWTRFFIRVTLPSEELITDEKAAKLSYYKPIIEFLRFVLVRDPLKRPNLDAVISRLEMLRMKLKGNENDQSKVRNDTRIQSIIDDVSCNVILEDASNDTAYFDNCVKLDEPRAEGAESSFRASVEDGSTAEHTIREASKHRESFHTQQSSSTWLKSSLSRLVCGACTNLGE
ncbi:hypothetical protein KP509_27G058000 [Ceratopteris richardii]|uniref:Protein kinase domain-containing protein n=1 Tax=Ceratopteris richardii TaxID=49495 RepID=A0A8T2RGU4_CERRI|nr:hypothetical protein KP509_27G058000 [Ceratopteris richardii]